jgi:hypothetical protein
VHDRFERPTACDCESPVCPRVHVRPVAPAGPASALESRRGGTVTMVHVRPAARRRQLALAVVARAMTLRHGLRTA